MRVSAAVLLPLVLLAPTLVATEEEVPEAWIVGLEEDAAVVASEGSEFAGAEVIASEPALDALVLDAPPDLSDEDADAVRYVERVQRRELFFTPNDPHLDLQYAVEATRLDEAWDVTRGSTSVKVCVVDTGLAMDHEDFAPIVAGRDFIEDDDVPEDEHGHGTHVAGILAARANNGKGIAGVAQVGLLVARVFDADGLGATSLVVGSAIRWCADGGAAVVSLSLGGGGSAFERDAVKYAVGKGALVVAASGNDGCFPCVRYPAAYPEAIAVGCTSEGHSLCGFSNRGPELDITAPGDDIVSAYAFDSDGYIYASGTSMSTPFVSGVAALVKSAEPSLGVSTLRARLLAGVTDLGANGWDASFGAGEVDALRALAPPGTVAFTLVNPAADVPEADVTFLRGGDVVASCAYDRSAQAFDSCDGASATGNAVTLASGRYTVRVEADGMTTQEKALTIQAGRTASLRVTLVSRLAVVQLKLGADAPPQFTLDLEPSGDLAAVSCAVDTLAREMSCDGATPGAWPTLRLEAGTYAVTATPDDEGRTQATGSTLRAKAGSRAATLGLSFGYVHAAISPTVNADLDAYALTVLEDDVPVASCDVDLADWDATSCTELLWPSPTPGVLYSDGSGGARWTLVVEPAGDKEGRAPALTLRAASYAAGKLHTPSAKLAPYGLTVSVRGPDASTSTITLVDAAAREHVSEGAAKTTFWWLAPGPLSSLVAENEDGLTSGEPPSVTIAAGRPRTVTLRLA